MNKERRGNRAIEANSGGDEVEVRRLEEEMEQGGRVNGEVREKAEWEKGERERLVRVFEGVEEESDRERDGGWRR